MEPDFPNIGYLLSFQHLKELTYWPYVFKIFLLVWILKSLWLWNYSQTRDEKIHGEKKSGKIVKPPKVMNQTVIYLTINWASPPSCGADIAFWISSVNAFDQLNMCVTNKGQTKFACGHSEAIDVTEPCQDFITYGECNNPETNYFGSNTSRNRVCAKCEAKNTKNGQKNGQNDQKKDDKGKEDDIRTG